MNEDYLSREILIMTIVSIFLFLFMICATKPTKCGQNESQEQPTAISERDEKIRDFLCEYAMKEIMEKEHQERTERISQQRQKWIAIAIGSVTTLVPLVVSILKSVDNNCSPHFYSNSTF
jgi:outer membrane lipoprotein-sorting protein